MQLCVFSNFTYPSIGGSEVVCKTIAESMINDYGMEVTCFGYNVKNEIKHNNVIYRKCPKGFQLIEEINKFDHLLIYSDSSWCFPTILTSIDLVKSKISIALVGMYGMSQDSFLFSEFIRKKHRFNVITHSKNYWDYKKCFEEKIPVTVIPNGVDIEEFKYIPGCKEEFRKKYNIKTEFIILNISNFFYGKNCEYLADIGKKLAEKRKKKDFTILSVSNSVKYPYEEIFLKRCQKRFKDKSKEVIPKTIREQVLYKNLGFEYKFLRNIPRQDVIDALFSAKVLVSVSGKEVAPLTILEAMATHTPWISMNVGNVEELEGGWIIKNPNFDDKGYKIINENIINNYAEKLNSMLDWREAGSELGYKGKEMVERYYQWKDICELYYNIFIS